MKRIFKVICLILAIIVLSGLPGFTVIAADNRTVSGTVSLPGGIKASIPEGYENIDSISFNILVYGAKDRALLAQQKVGIPAGQNSAVFSVAIPAESSEKQYIIKYDNDSYSYATSDSIHIDNNYYPWVEGVLPYGYYRQGGATAYEDEATPVDSSKSGNIALVLIPSKTIKGKITDTTSTGAFYGSPITRNTSIVIKAIDVSTPYSFHTITTAVYLSKDTVGYSIRVPASKQGYRILYDIFTYQGTGPVADSAYFSNAGTVPYAESATVIQADTNVENINMNLTAIRKISGRVSLPKGMKASSKDLTVYIGAIPDYMAKDPGSVPQSSYWMRAGALSSAGAKTVKILKGETSVDYSFLVPANTSKWGYKLRYAIYDTNGLALEKIGYLSSAGVSSLIGTGSFLDVSKTDKVNTVFTVLKKGEKGLTGGKSVQGNPGTYTGYDVNFIVGRDWGSSTITIDNSKSSSNIYAKLYYIGSSKTEAVRVFSVKKGGKFTMENLSGGTYELRVRDITAVTQYKTDRFTLKDTEEEFTNMTITLSGVKDGNLQTHPIKSNEF